MEYQEFLKCVKGMIVQRMPDKKVELHKIIKNNDVVRDGLIIRKRDSQISPTIYLNEYYDKYMDGTQLSEIVEEVLQIYKQYAVDHLVDEDFFRDFKRVRARVVYKLIGLEANRNLLKTIPYIPFLDMAIVFYYMFEPTEDQKQWAQFFADEGVDVVIGGHPHVLEPVDVVTGKNGNEMICYYSLGNFISHQSENYQMLGGLATLTITKDDSGTYVSAYQLEPTMTWMRFGGNGYQFYGMKLEDYTEDMAVQHHVSSCGIQTMWDLYYDIVGDTPEAQVASHPASDTSE